MRQFLFLTKKVLQVQSAKDKDALPFTTTFEGNALIIHCEFIRTALLWSSLLVSCVGLAQNNLWVVGDNLVNFNNSSLISTLALPQPAVLPALQPFVYAGQVANNNQYAEYDQNGNLLFFIIDGNIYDRDGFMIADANDGNCEICFPDNSISSEFEPITTNNLVVTKVPGYCDKYYLSVYSNLAILDLALPNYFFPTDPSRMGSLVPLEAIQFGDFDYDNMDLTVFFDQNIPASVGELDVQGYYVKLPFERHGGHTTIGIYEDIYDNNVNGTKYLGIATDGFITQYELRTNGAFYLNNNSQPGTQGEGWPPTGALEYSKYNGQRLAALSVSVAGTANFDNSSVFVTKLNNDMSFNVTTSFNPHIAGISGSTGDLEFSENGRYLFYTINVAPYLGVIDLFDNSVSELSDLVTISNPLNYINGRLELNYYQQVPSIYFISANGLSILKGCNDLSTATFIPNAIIISPIPDYNLGVAPFSIMYLLPKQSYKDSQIQSLSLASCCQYIIDESAYQGAAISAGTATWSYGANNNPWNATGPVQMSGDLIFSAGSNVTINGMEFRFGPNSNVIINTGAIVKLNSNSKWTSYECERAMWPGVDMIGQPNQLQPNNNVAYSTQPILIIDHSTIENALIGVEVGTTISNGGGVVKGYSATIHNCQIGVRYQKYQSNQSGAWYTSRWIVDAHLKDPNINPIAMVSMRDMVGSIYFGDCSFIHDTPLSVYPMELRGTAIKSINSRFSLSCSNAASSSYTGPTDLNHTSFYKWRYGIFATNGGTTSFGVSKMYFQECNIGISASAINTASIVENYFHIPNVANISFQKPRGVILTGCTGYTFRENDFYSTIYNASAQNVGAMIVSSGDLENTSYRNDFDKLWKGQEVQGDNRGQDDLVGLQLRCNTYSNTKYDQYLASNAEWRHNQGDATAMAKLANNRFSYANPNCVDGNYDMYISPTHAASFVFDYIRPNNDFYDPNSSDNNATCTSPHMIDFCSSELSATTNPVYSEICPVKPSVLVIGSGIMEHSSAIANLQSARTMYTTIVDANEKTNIEAEIFKAFPMESNLMRDYLLARSPLSDQIMKDAINKNGLLDPWHLTQVLLANGPLTKDVLTHLEETQVLSSFFMSFLYDAYATGSPSYRKLLENEIAARENERHSALIALTEYYNSHADHLDVGELIKPIMLADGSAEAKIWLLEYYIEHADATAALEVISELSLVNEMIDFAALKSMQLNLNSDWSLATAGQMGDLETWAANPLSSAFANSLSILHSLDLSDMLPEPEVPIEEKSMEITKDQSRNLFSKPSLSAYPNPANEITFINYPTESDGIGQLEILDCSGQIVLTTKLSTKGIYELNTSAFKPGVYVLRILVEGKSYADCKLIVVD